MELNATDHATNYRPDARCGLMPTWGLSTDDGKRVGTVWETERGYAGQISGTDANGKHHEYECPELNFRQSVIDHLAIQAQRLGIA